MEAFLGSSVLGDILKRYRKERNMTQAEVAYKSKINESYVSSVEHGYSLISLAKYLDFCEGVDVDPMAVMEEFLLKREDLIEADEEVQVEEDEV